ncbi:MAG: hypothetical protein K2N05_05990 [Muribaculaceae bacterium]|nr:hypothetical protein [Muribaculaceae bacterium]
MIHDNNPNLTQLISDIEKYFDCLLSEEEEADLIRRVALTEIRHPLVEEAKVVMGFRTLASDPCSTRAVKPRRHSRLSPLLNGRRIAAAVALILTLGCLLRFALPSPPSSECIAFVKGSTITEEEKVLELMLQNISEFNQGAEEAEEEILDDLNLLSPLSE